MQHEKRGRLGTYRLTPSGYQVLEEGKSEARGLYPPLIEEFQNRLVYSLREDGYYAAIYHYSEGEKHELLSKNVLNITEKQIISMDANGPHLTICLMPYDGDGKTMQVIDTSGKILLEQNFTHVDEYVSVGDALVVTSGETLAFYHFTGGYSYTKMESVSKLAAGKRTGEVYALCNQNFFERVIGDKRVFLRQGLDIVDGALPHAVLSLTEDVCLLYYAGGGYIPPSGILYSINGKSLA